MSEPPRTPAAPPPREADPAALRAWEWPLAAAVALAALVVLRPASLGDPYWWDAAAVYVPGSRWVADHHFLAVPGVFPSLLGRGHTTLYYVVTAIGFRLFGSAPVVAHAIVLAFSVLGVVATYALGARLFGRPAGIAAAILLLVAPLWLSISSQALPEIPLAALTVVSLHAFARGRHGEAAAWGVAVVLTKETGLACPLAIVGALALWMIRERSSRAAARPLVFASIPVAVLAIFFVWQRVAEGWWVLPFHAELFEQEHDYLAQGTLVLRSMIADDGRAIALAGAIAIGLVRWRRGELSDVPAPPAGAPPRWVVVAAIALVFLAYQVFFTKMWFLERYALAGHPSVAILLAGALVPEHPARHRVTAALAAIVVALTCVLAIGSRFAGSGYDSGETTFRYLHAVEAHLEIYRELDARPDAPRVLTTWPMTEELRDPELAWVARPYRAIGLDGYLDAREDGEPVPEIDAIVTQEGLGAHDALVREAARLGMRRTRRAEVGGAAVELYER